jgi:hypothetical protein
MCLLVVALFLDSWQVMKCLELIYEPKVRLCCERRKVLVVYNTGDGGYLYSKIGINHCILYLSLVSEIGFW